jgi:translocation and assembly module TamA
MKGRSRLARWRPRWTMLLAAALLLPALLAATAARAADPQAYDLAFVPSGNNPLDSALKASSDLQSLRGKGPLSPFALIGRARRDTDRLQTVLRSFGYYAGAVTITIDGHALDEPSLAELLTDMPQGKSAQVSVTVRLGPQYHLRAVNIEGGAPADARARLGLAPGAPAIAADVLAARERLLTALLEDGYALAKVDPPLADEDRAASTLDITFKVSVGPRVAIGDISFTGLQRIDEDFLRRRLLVHPGEQYAPDKIEKAREDLLSLGVFSGITARSATQVDASGRLPLVFECVERPLHAVGVSASYSTDLGGGTGLSWSHRNLFGNAEQLNLSASAIGAGGSATTGLGYNATAQFIKPDFLQRDQSLQFNLGAIRQDLQAYDQTATTAGVSLNRKLTPVWSASAGVSAEHEWIEQEGTSRSYMLLGLPLSLKYDNTGLSNPLADPTHGFRGSLIVTPTLSLGTTAATGNATFFIVQNNASTYFDLAKLGLTAPGHTILAARALVGSALGASQFDLPPDQRFYAGGSTTVRGYRYQSLGPQFPDGVPTGGTAIDAASLELRQRLPGDFGMAVFVDAGHVSANGAPFQGTLHTGAGMGIRYYTPIGAIRLDFAVPLNKIPGGDTFEVYVGLGQAF